ncbi:MAG TPA: helix-turn-helix transcriptional regulator [Candidatus Acidoferrales bacterium]|nr:helix-turn-helix transcriptional regulator [Candidatus Acidoferrales bacterium]
MKISSTNTDEVALEELGRRLTRTRLEHNLTQAELATQAGISKRTVERLEAGETAMLSTFIRVLRVLGLLDALDQLLPEPTLSPLERLKLLGKQRRRGSGTRITSKASEEAEPWRWGDEPKADAP